MTATKRPQLGLMVCAVLALGACGGGSDVAEVQAPPPATASGTVPDSAMASALSFIQFQQGLAISDTIEPLTLQKLLPPLDDTAEPIPIGGG